MNVTPGNSNEVLTDSVKGFRSKLEENSKENLSQKQ